MFDFDNPGNDLDWMEDELLEDEESEDEEEDYEELPRRVRRRIRREEEHSMDDREAIFVEKKRRKDPREKGIGKFKFLAFMEILAILAVIWGWIKWLY